MRIWTSQQLNHGLGLGGVGGWQGLANSLLTSVCSEICSEQTLRVSRIGQLNSVNRGRGMCQVLKQLYYHCLKTMCRSSKPGMTMKLKWTSQHTHAHTYTKGVVSCPLAILQCLSGLMSKLWCRQIKQTRGRPDMLGRCCLQDPSKVKESVAPLVSQKDASKLKTLKARVVFFGKYIGLLLFDLFDDLFEQF